MKPSKQILFFTLSVAGFAALECLLTAFLSPLVEESLFLSRSFPYIARLLAVIPPFLALGTAVEAIRVRGLGYAYIYMGIYAGVTLFAQIPLSLVAYDPSYSAPYAVLLLSYMLSAVVTVALFSLFLLLGYALFMQNETASEDTPIFSLQGKDARVLALGAALLTLYHLILEGIGIVEYINDRLGIITGEDLFSMAFSILFFSALGVFCFLVGRISSRLFPAPYAIEGKEEDDFI